MIRLERRPTPSRAWALSTPIIAVILNGMNLTGTSSFRQNMVLGIIILAAVLLDRMKQRLIAKRS